MNSIKKALVFAGLLAFSGVSSASDPYKKYKYAAAAGLAAGAAYQGYKEWQAHNRPLEQNKPDVQAGGSHPALAGSDFGDLPGDIQGIVGMYHEHEKMELVNVLDCGEGGWFPPSLKSARFNHDGSQIITADGNTFASNGPYEALTSNHRVIIWNTEGKAPVKIRVLEHNAVDARFNYDGTRAITTSTYDSDGIKIWDLTTAAPALPRGKPGDEGYWAGAQEPILTIPNGLYNSHFRPDLNFQSACFSPDGALILAVGGGVAKLYNAVTGAFIHRIRVPQFSINDANFNHDGTQIVTATSDRHISIWNVATGALIREFGDYFGDQLATGCISAHFNHDGTQVVATYDEGRAKVWNAITGEKILTLGGEESAIADFGAGLVNMITVNLVKLNKLKSNLQKTAEFSNDGEYIVTTGIDGSVHVWRVGNGSHLMKYDGPGAVGASFNHDGTKVVAPYSKLRALILK